MATATITLQQIRDARNARTWAECGIAQAIRVQAGLSRSDVAAVLGVTESAVVMWESGTRRPRIRIAAAYGRLLLELSTAPRLTVPYE